MEKKEKMGLFPFFHSRAEGVVREEKRFIRHGCVKRHFNHAADVAFRRSRREVPAHAQLAAVDRVASVCETASGAEADAIIIRHS